MRIDTDLIENPMVLSALIDSIMPAVRVAGTKLVDMMDEVNQQQQEFFNQWALLSKNFVDAYVSNGFTREEAIALLINMQKTFTSSRTTTR